MKKLHVVVETVFSEDGTYVMLNRAYKEKSRADAFYAELLKYKDIDSKLEILTVDYFK